MTPIFTISKLLMLIALLIFVLAAFSVSLGGIALVPLGLAFMAAAYLVP